MSQEDAGQDIEQIEAVRLTQQELDLMNAATRLFDVAKVNLECALRPIREKYGLPGPFNYDRGTGEIAVPQVQKGNGADG